MGRLCVAVSCSPREKGNTEILLKTATDALAATGVKVETYRLADLEYSPCRACGGCDSTGRCVIPDGAGPLFDRILKADIFILAAPIFSMGICAQAKMFIDRSQQFWAARYLLNRPVVEDEQLRGLRRGIFISAAGTNLSGVFDGAVRVTRYFYKMLEIKLEGFYCYPGTDKKGEILANGRALEEVKEAGLKLAHPAADSRPKRSSV